MQLIYSTVLNGRDVCEDVTSTKPQHIADVVAMNSFTDSINGKNALLESH